MVVTQSALAPVRGEKVTLTAADSNYTINTRGLSALIKVVEGTIYVDGRNSPVAASESSFPLEKGETLTFSGILHVALGAEQTGSSELRILYFDTI